VDGGDLCNFLDYQMLAPILRTVKQLIKLLGRHFPIKTAKGALDGALDDDLLLVRHKANIAESILPKHWVEFIPAQPIHARYIGMEQAMGISAGPWNQRIANTNFNLATLGKTTTSQICLKKW
jgi:hypothetical protein